MTTTVTKNLISLKRSLDNVYLTESIINPNKKIQVLFKAPEWRGVLTLTEVRKLNEVYNRYLNQASFLYEGVGYHSPIALWEHFLRLEDKVNLNEFFGNIWNKVKGAATAVGSAVGGAYKGVRRGLSSATTEKVFGKSKKGKAQETEFKNMISAGAASAMTKAVPTYFPNNDEFEEFQENLAGALDAAMEYIEKNCKGDGVAASKELVNVKKWIVYTADHSLGDRYKHFEGGHRSEEDEETNESFNRKNLKCLYEAEAKAEKKDKNAIGTTADESDAWKSMSSEKLAKILKGGGLLIAGAAFAMMVPGLLDSFKHASSGHDVVSQVTDTVNGFEGKDVKVPFDFSKGLDLGIVGGMKSAGFDPTNSDSVKGFYDMMGGESGHSAFFDNLAKAQGKTGKAHDLFVEYMNQSYDKGVTPTHMGMSASPTSGTFAGMDMSGTTNKSLLGMAKPNVTLSGVVTSAVTKSVIRYVTTYVTSGAGGAVAHAGLLAAAPVALAAGLVAMGGGFLISWVRKHGKTKSRLKFLMDTLAQVDALYAKVGGKPEAIAVTPPVEPPTTDSPPVRGREVEEPNDGRGGDGDNGGDGGGGGGGGGGGDDEDPDAWRDNIGKDDGGGDGGGGGGGDGGDDNKSDKPQSPAAPPPKESVKKKTTINAGGSAFSSLVNDFSDSAGIKDKQEKQAATNVGAAMLKKLMSKKALLEGRKRSRLREAVSGAPDLEAERDEKDTYIGSAKEHPMFSELVAAVNEHEKLIPKGYTAEKFVEDFLTHLISKDMIGLPDEIKVKKVDPSAAIAAAKEIINNSNISDKGTGKGGKGPSDKKKALDEVDEMAEVLVQIGKLNDGLSNKRDDNFETLYQEPAVNYIDKHDGFPQTRTLSRKQALAALMKVGAVNESFARRILKKYGDMNMILESFKSHRGHGGVVIVERWQRLAGIIG